MQTTLGEPLRRFLEHSARLVARAVARQPVMADEPVAQAEFVQGFLLRMRTEGCDILRQSGIQADERFVEQFIIARQASHVQPHHVLGDFLDVGSRRRPGGLARIQCICNGSLHDDPLIAIGSFGPSALSFLYAGKLLRDIEFPSLSGSEAAKPVNALLPRQTGSPDGCRFSSGRDGRHENC